MNKWIAEFELEDGDTMPEHMDLNYMGAKIDFHCRPLWIPISERLPKVDEEACSDNVLVSLRKTTWDINKCQMVHVTKIAYYDKYAICSDGMYFDTEGWVLENGNTLSMDEVIAWQPLPQIYKESEE